MVFRSCRAPGYNSPRNTLKDAKLRIKTPGRFAGSISLSKFTKSFRVNWRVSRAFPAAPEQAPHKALYKGTQTRAHVCPRSFNLLLRELC
jgi:hypothetical protein